MIALLLFLAQEIPDHPDKLQYPPLKFEVPDPDAMRSTLPNGMVVYALEDPAVPLVHLQIYFPGGTFSDPAGKEGLGDMLGSLMHTGGTKTRTPQQLDEELDFLAADLGVGLGDVNGSATLSLLSKDLDRGLEILNDVLRNPEFRQEKIDLYKTQMYVALKARNDSTAAIETREANLLLYGEGHPVNRLPTKASIEAVTREDLIAAHRKIVNPSRMIVAAAGSFKRDELMKKLGATFDRWPWNEKLDRAAIPDPKIAAPAVYGFNKDEKNITQGRVTLAHIGIRLDHPDLHAIRIMNYIYGGGGFTSRLMQRVRTDEGLAYDVGSQFQPGIAYVGTFRIKFQSKNESCPYAIQLCLEELKKMQEKEPDAKVVEEARKFYLDGFPAFFFSTKFQTVQTFAAAELNGYPKGYYQRYRDEIAKVTPADVLRVAREHMKPEKFVIVAVGNLEAMMKGDGKHATLKDFGPVKNMPLPNPETLERTK